MPIEALATAAQEWSIQPLDGVGSVESPTPSTGGTGGTGGGSFGSMLGDQIKSLESLQNDAAHASRSLADGTATDPSQVVMAVEKAQLAMQLAAQLRTKAVDAVSEVMRTQV